MFNDMNDAPAECYKCKIKGLSCKYICYQCLEKTSWISVKDELPSNEKWVACLIENKKPVIGFFSQTFRNWKVNGFGDVTHWMPLPKLPEKEK